MREYNNTVNTDCRWANCYTDGTAIFPQRDECGWCVHCYYRASLSRVEEERDGWKEQLDLGWQKSIEKSIKKVLAERTIAEAAERKVATLEADTAKLLGVEWVEIQQMALMCWLCPWCNRLYNKEFYPDKSGLEHAADCPRQASLKEVGEPTTSNPTIEP